MQMIFEISKKRLIEGSAGCIDIGGGLFGNEETNRLIEAIRAETFFIDVEVRP